MESRPEMAPCRARDDDGRTVRWAVALAVLCGTTADAVERMRALQGSEITKKFTGMEFTDDVHWAYVFERGGSLNVFSMGSAGTGSWRVHKDELCLNRGKRDATPCGPQATRSSSGARANCPSKASCKSHRLGRADRSFEEPANGPKYVAA